jgi:type I restriction enzyme S subunit
LFSRANTIDLVGKVVLVGGTSRRLMLSDKILRLLTKTNGVDTKWLLYALRTPHGRAEIQRLATGNQESMRNIGQDRIRQIQIPLAPRPEQQRVVAEIEKQFTRLDAGVEALKRVQVQLKRYRASVLKAACEGRLVPTEAELARREKRDYESADKLLARTLKERRAKWEANQVARLKAAGKAPKDDRWKARYTEPQPSQVQGLPRLPEGWAWASVESLASKVVDGVHKKPDYVQSGVPFVTVRNLTATPGISFENLNYVSEADHAEFSKRANPERGDLLISKDGTLGVTRVIRTDRPFSIFVSVALIKPIMKAMSDYMELALASPQVQRQMVPKGTGLVHIHLEDLREDCIPLAPFAEQLRIVAEVQRRLSIIDEVEAFLDADGLRAERLRHSILKLAFEGKLVPQDPKDEPATALLERIRAQRQVPEAAGHRKKNTNTKPATAA